MNTAKLSDESLIAPSEDPEERQHLDTVSFTGENRSQLLWSRQVQHKRQHLETVSFTGREPKPTVVVATGAA